MSVNQYGIEIPSLYNYGSFDYIKDQQKKLGVKVDGIWGRNSADAFAKKNLLSVVGESTQPSIPISTPAYSSNDPFNINYKSSSEANNSPYNINPNEERSAFYGDGSNISSAQSDTPAPITNIVDPVIPGGGKPGSTPSYLGDAWKSLTGMFSPTDAGTSMSALHQNYLDTAGKSYTAPTYDKDNKILLTPGSGLSEGDWTKQMQLQQGVNDHTFAMGAGTLMGMAQLGLGAFGAFGPNGSMDMNKKNMEVMDGQIANNNSIMDTRNARAADIKKYFG